MMYANKLAAAIKVNGRVLREIKDTVYVPFGSEYTILVKNLNTVRVLANIFVDGENAVPGGLVLNAGQEVDLERWIKNGNLSEGNRFKFIERTGAVEKHRGVKLEDGLIRIEYQFEKVYPVSDWYQNSYKKTGYGYEPPQVWYGTSVYNTAYPPLIGSVTTSSITSGGVLRGSSTGAIPMNATTQTITTTSASFSAPNDAGITVAGSHSDQKFSVAGWFATELEKHSMVFKLLGETEANKPVEQPITVKHKPRCTTCGKQNKAKAKFCAECGTALEIFA